MDGGTIIAKTLKQKGIHHVFTLCGGHISPILVSARQSGIRVIDVRHEATAVFAADAAARLTGIPGVAVVTAGPGVTNTVTAVKNAQMAQSPVVLLGGAAPTVLKGRGALQDIDHRSLMQPLVKAAFTIHQNCDIVPTLDEAFGIAASGVPGPVFVECPVDLLYTEELVRSWYLGATGDDAPQGLRKKLQQLYLKHHVDRMFACDISSVTAEGREDADDDIDSRAVAAAMNQITASQRPVIVMGSQALARPGLSTELARAVAAMGIPIYLAGMARGLMGAGHRLQMRHHRREALKEADLVILAGMPCDFRLNYGRAINPAARVIAINRSRQELFLNRRPDTGIHADAGAFLCALAPVAPAPDHGWDTWITLLQQRETARDADIARQAAQDTEHVNPLTLLAAVDRHLADDSVIVADGGDFVASAAYILKPRRPLSWLDPGVFGTLGVGAGFALGARIHRPEAEVWLIYGDGAAGYSLTELDTMVRHGLPVIALVGNDASWAQIARDQIALLKDDVATVLRPTDYHVVAEGFGARGLLLERAADIESVLTEARQIAAAGSPVLINARIGRTDFRKGSMSM
ncbi:MAG: thiamine pyrophosphate-binding protein [Pseudomonadota bacterium]